MGMVAFLKHKSDAFAVFKEWLICVEKQTGQQLYIFHSDNGGEFLTKEWRQMLKDRGICHETTSPDTPEQNGNAKRQNHSIFDRVCTVLIDVAFLYSCLLKLSTTLFTPKTTTPPVHSPTPHHTMYGSTRNLTSLDFIHLAAKPMSKTTHPTARSYLLVLLRVSSLGMQIHRRPIGYISLRSEQLFALFTFALM